VILSQRRGRDSNPGGTEKALTVFETQTGMVRIPLYVHVALTGPRCMTALPPESVGKPVPFACRCRKLGCAVNQACRMSFASER
jgi:hypothetical protein